MRNRLASKRDLVYAYLMGWPRIAVYDGGWFEWSQDPISNPIETGDPLDRPPRSHHRAVRGFKMPGRFPPGAAELT